jgi:two-component system NtrC family sensor kinase
MKRLYRKAEESIKAKLIIAIGLLIIIGSSIFWYAILQKQKKDIMSIAVRYAASFSDYIRERTRYNMLNQNRNDIQKTLEDISLAKGVESVRIYNHTGNISYSTFKKDVGTMVDQSSLACRSCHNDLGKTAMLLKGHKRWDFYKDAKGDTALKFIEPIYNDTTCYTSECHVHQKEETILGFIMSDMSLSLLDEAQFKQGLALTGYVLIFIVAISIALVIILYKIVSKPVSELAHGMKMVAEGNLDYSVKIYSRDEIGLLAEAFNSMTKDIRASRYKMEEWTRTLEEEVAKKTEEIRKTHASLVQTEKLASLGRMAAGVAHEINNPLTGVVTFAHLLLKRVPPDSEEAQDINIIIEQADRCARIIKNLLMFARAGSTEKGEVNINDVLNKAIFMLKNQEKFYNIKFRIDQDTSPLITFGDFSQFQQIFLNMLINAADAMNERGTITVVSRKMVENGRPYVEVEFTDTGCGIKKEDMSKLFEPFFTTKPAEKGTGLGLSVSHGIVSQYGGNIKVESKEGEGTSFFVRLPLKED